MSPRHLSYQSGSALLLVLWALLFLSGAVLSWALWMQQGITLQGEANRALEARTMAHSGLAIGLNPLVTRLTPSPAETVGPDMGFRVRLISEGAKLNLNWLVDHEDPRRLAILKLWLQQRGLEYSQRERFVDCLLDYCDADNVTRLNGGEETSGYHPANRTLRSVAELREVQGTGPLTAQPGWADALTVYSTGPVDLACAPMEILRLLPGLGETQIKRLVTFRRGVDGRDGTPDDGVLSSLKDVQTVTGMSDEGFVALQGLVMVNDPSTQIISTGYSQSVTRTIEVVARKTGGKPQILAWKE